MLSFGQVQEAMKNTLIRTLELWLIQLGDLVMVNEKNNLVIENFFMVEWQVMNKANSQLIYQN